ncbi:unnamed protein product [Penicillium roqueforti FM164]|uniref:Genomic scaffold, ProqFM164S03 n=1 Tax=Penicillium roqueforti (strain FM164) TaxID=1365484 RepID=W6QGF5_PENRF|nr:unnamed protein product [Penicillium roqueforti FM164]
MDTTHKTRWFLAAVRRGYCQNYLKVHVCICHGLIHMTQALIILGMNEAETS